MLLFHWTSISWKPPMCLGLCWGLRWFPESSCGLSRAIKRLTQTLYEAGRGCRTMSDLVSARRVICTLTPLPWPGAPSPLTMSYDAPAPLHCPHPVPFATTASPAKAWSGWAGFQDLGFQGLKKGGAGDSWSPEGTRSESSCPVQFWGLVGPSEAHPLIPPPKSSQGIS